MDNLNEKYIPHLEWELTEFPIKLDKLKFEINDWEFSDTSCISIWRDDAYKLKGKISGRLSDSQEFKEENFVGKGNIVQGQKITGFDSNNNIVELEGCLLTGIHSSSNQSISEGDLILDSVKIIFNPNEKLEEDYKHYHWFLCREISAHFTHTTFRNKRLTNKKIREGLDEFEDSAENYIGSSTSRDYIIVDLPEIKFIVAKVPNEFLTNEVRGLCLEFRENLDKINNDLLVGVQHLISFLLGNEIQYLGYSIIDGEVLEEAHLTSLTEMPSKNTMSPIKFNLQYEWGDISYLFNTLLPKYLNQRKKLPLDDSLSRYWIAKRIPIGSNLPVLASALEIIAERYLKDFTDFKAEYLSKESFLELIQEEKKGLENKLEPLEGGSIMLSKIINA